MVISSRAELSALTTHGCLGRGQKEERRLHEKIVEGWVAVHKSGCDSFASRETGKSPGDRLVQPDALAAQPIKAQADSHQKQHPQQKIAGLGKPARRLLPGRGLGWFEGGLADGGLAGHGDFRVGGASGRGQRPVFYYRSDNPSIRAGAGARKEDVVDSASKLTFQSESSPHALVRRTPSCGVYPTTPGTRACLLLIRKGKGRQRQIGTTLKRGGAKIAPPLFLPVLLLTQRPTPYPPSGNRRRSAIRPRRSSPG